MFPFSELTDEEFKAMFPSNYDTNENGVYFNGHWYPCEDDEVYDTCLVDYPWA